ncbi:MAG: hypothetical protein JNN30_18210 [Rhodanobacteraceae bacterium]|nr:hypothetical protein [Rhodanobacteraceae bacterium]
MIVPAKRLIEEPLNLPPHVVLLGAGASRAAFPNGDAGGHRLPVMNDFVTVLGLSDLLRDVPQGANFEDTYSLLRTDPQYTSVADELEQRIYEYFTELSLPDTATLYDRLVLSMRGTDAIFTFNWDPFLFDAYLRNRDVATLPEIFFLHGNVRIGSCLDHGRWGHYAGLCPDCGKPYTSVPLLYPIGKKDYSSSGYIAGSWDNARAWFKGAFTMTVFGYGAPQSDADAVELLRSSWLEKNEREMEHVHIIDLADDDVLHERWAPFTPTLHLHTYRHFSESHLARWPRRSCESIFYPMRDATPCLDFPLPETESLDELQDFVRKIATHEPPAT